MGTRSSAVASATRSRRWRIILVSICGLLAAALAAAPTQAAFGPAAQWGSTGSGNGQFNTARGVATDSTGNVYVVDWTNARVQKFTSTGTFVTKWGSTGTANGQFNAPLGIATDSAGNVYVADSANQRIQKFNASGGFLTKWGSLGTANGKFHGPYGVATDSAGNVYVVDQENSRIQKFNSNGGFITKWGTAGSGNGQFNNPVGIATDSAGNVYVVDRDNNRIQKFTSSGAFITKWGSAGSGAGQFAAARGIAIDQTGDVYVSDVGNNRVQKFSSMGTFRGTWGWGVRDGSSAFQVCGVACQQGIAGSGVGQFSSLGVGVAIRGGKIYTVDANRVQVFEGAPEVTIESAPDETTSDTTASLTFASDEDGAFECSLDGGGWEPCSSPYATGELSDGGHSFAVRATNLLGIPSEEASHEWVVDTTAPEPGVSGALADSPGGWVNQGDYEATGSAQDSGSGVTELELLVDDEPVDAVSQPCGSGGCSFDHTFTVDTSEYGGGAHTAELVATDAAGNAESETWDFNVNRSGVIPASEAAAILELADPSMLDPIDDASGGAVMTQVTDGFAVQTSDGPVELTPGSVSANATTQHGVGDEGFIWANTADDLDTALRQVSGGVGSVTQLRSEAAPGTLTWQVDLTGGRALEESEDGSIRVRASNGDNVLNIADLGAQDGAGSTLPTDLSVSGNTVTLSVDRSAAQITNPIEVAVAVQAYSPADELDQGAQWDDENTSVVLPAQGEDEAVLAGEGGELTLALPASGEPVDTVGGVKFFEGPPPETEISIGSLGFGAEAGIHIDDPAAPEEYEFAVGGDADELVPQEDGNTAVLDETGEYVGLVAEPWAHDAAGSPVPTHYEFNGLGITQVVDHQGGDFAYPITADPPVITATKIGWRFGRSTSRAIFRAVATATGSVIGSLVCARVKKLPGLSIACSALVGAILGDISKKAARNAVDRRKCIEVGVSIHFHFLPPFPHPHPYAKTTDC